MPQRQRELEGRRIQLHGGMIASRCVIRNRQLQSAPIRELICSRSFQHKLKTSDYPGWLSIKQQLFVSAGDPRSGQVELALGRTCTDKLQDIPDMGGRDAA
jgi:hypothetical protein